jgi:hypothetical protein
MPTLKNYVPQIVQDFFPFNRVTSIISTVIAKTLHYLRVGNPTVNNIADAYEKSTDISHIVKTAAYHNIVLYAVPVAGVKLFFEPVVRNYVPILFPAFSYVEESVWIGLAVSMLVSNLFYNVALTQAVSKHLPAGDEDLPSCIECNWQEKLGGNTANILLYASLLSAASALNLAPAVIPENVVWLLQAMAYGYSLGGLQYSAQGVCTQHFSILLNNNKIYYTSLGAMVIYSVKQSSAALTRMTGMTANFYVDDAIFSVVWHQAILLVILQSKSPDYLGIVRNSIKDLQALTLNYILNNNYASKKRDYVTKVNKFLQSPPGEWLLAREPVQLALNVHQTELLRAVDWLEWLHENRMANIALMTTTFVIDRLPKQLKGHAQLFSDLLQQQDWQQLAALVKIHLQRIELYREVNESVARIEKFKELAVYDGRQAQGAYTSICGRIFQLFVVSDRQRKPVAELKIEEDEFEEIDGLDEAEENKRNPNCLSPVLVELPTNEKAHTQLHRRRG